MAVRRCPTHSYGTRTAVQTAHCRCRRPLTCARNADSATNRPAMLILALRSPTDHQDERYGSSYAGSLQTVSSQCSSRACRESMPTTAVLVYADSGDVAVLARTAWSFCSAVSIRARVRWIGQHAVDGGVSRSSPDHLVTRGGNGNLQSVF